MSYKRSYTKTYDNVTAKQVWAIWSDIDKRSTWDNDTEWAEITGDFVTGNHFRFKPKGGPILKMQIVERTSHQSFTDYFRMPFGHLYGIHTLKSEGNKLRITTTIEIKGLLFWLWQKLLGEKIVATLPEQTELLVQAARQVR